VSLVDGVLVDLAERPAFPSLSDRMRMAARDRDRYDMPATMKALRQLVAAQAGQLGTIETLVGQLDTNVRAVLERLEQGADRG
jgi:hypothetical protein